MTANQVRTPVMTAFVMTYQMATHLFTDYLMTILPLMPHQIIIHKWTIDLMTAT